MLMLTFLVIFTANSLILLRFTTPSSSSDAAATKLALKNVKELSPNKKGISFWRTSRHAADSDDDSGDDHDHTHSPGSSRGSSRDFDVEEPGAVQSAKKESSRSPASGVSQSKKPQKKKKDWMQEGVGKCDAGTSQSALAKPRLSHAIV